jgi:hypothetical protein
MYSKTAGQDESREAAASRLQPATAVASAASWATRGTPGAARTGRLHRHELVGYSAHTRMSMQWHGGTRRQVSAGAAQPAREAQRRFFSQRQQQQQMSGGNIAAAGWSEPAAGGASRASFYSGRATGGPTPRPLSGRAHGVRQGGAATAAWQQRQDVQMSHANASGAPAGTHCARPDAPSADGAGWSRGRRSEQHAPQAQRGSRWSRFQEDPPPTTDFRNTTLAPVEENNFFSIGAHPEDRMVRYFPGAVRSCILYVSGLRQRPVPFACA